MKNYQSRIQGHLLLWLLLICFSVCSCQQSATLSQSELKAIVKERNDKLGRYFIKGDADSLAMMYAPEARLCLNGLDFVTGRQAIKAFWRNDMKGTKTHEMVTETITVNGVKDVIYETGRTHIKMTYLDSTFTLTVKYCNVWRLQSDGTYKLDVDIANRDGATVQ